MKYWEIVADKLSAAGWSWGYCSAVTPRWMAVDNRCPSRRSPLHGPFWRTAERIPWVGTDATVAAESV